MAPTIMVARVSMASRRADDHRVDSASSQSHGDVLSNLQFVRDGRSTNQNETVIDLRMMGASDHHFVSSPTHREDKVIFTA